MPWIAAAAIAGSALIGGYSSMAAGNAQAGAANNSAQLQNQQYQQTREDLAPWRNSGVGALNQINALMGLGGSGSGAYYGPSGGQGGQPSGPSPGVLAAQAAGPHSGNVGTQLMFGGLNRKNASPIQDIAGALAQGRTITDAQWAQAGFGPGGSSLNSLQSPSLAQANPTIAPPGSGAPVDAQTAQTNAFAQFRTDPGYQFAFDQGQKAIANSAAARGILNSGQTAIALQQYGQGQADQQYGNYFNRLQSLAGLGQNATNATGQFGATSAANQGNALMAGGNARASAYGGVGTSANQGIQNYLAYNMNQNGGGGYASYAGGNWNPGAQGFPQ